MRNEKEKKVSFIIGLIKKIFKDDIIGNGAQLAYFLMLAFIPFLIFLITLIGKSRISSDDLLMFLSTIMPKTSFELIKTTIGTIIDTQRSDVMWGSIILAIWVSSSGFGAVIKGLNMSYDVQETRSYILRKFLSIVYTLLLAWTIAMTLLLFVFGGVIEKFIILKLHHQFLINIFWYAGRYSIILIVMFIIFLFLYNVTPCKRLGWKEVMPGAIFTTIGWIVTSLIFTFYVNNFNNYARIYGGLSAVFAIMIWLFISSLTLLVGGELNAYIIEYKKKKNK
ncbi:MAG: YihY/virulence factor BrkB family protein [Sarcina ventriculi]|uniref:YihY/virulence factor BrkB family protein n=1 Tax=Candidatus Sarcina troglodytae TaxID=2726954 RepID=A0ACD1BAN5_9CLOT|nr:YihY/virulence factor BrkB family protein [Sarcina sp. JB2]MCI5635683.1 YihY/virulence factor BrkB family protein [Sarcina ventriculi]MDY7062658.1 YihY/virulence factor BrkB family protein [Sarcina ventriculi]QPJ84516.1 YihY/virulence factor BrkB family protein [Sarcina sp. JB2]